MPVKIHKGYGQTEGATCEDVNELEASMNWKRARFPSLHHRKEGRAASLKRFRAATEGDAAGVVFLLDRFASIRKTTPAELPMEASRHLIDRSATPPCGDARRGMSLTTIYSH